MKKDDAIRIQRKIDEIRVDLHKCEKNAYARSPAVHMTDSHLALASQMLKKEIEVGAVAFAGLLADVSIAEDKQLAEKLFREETGCSCEHLVIGRQVEVTCYTPCADTRSYSEKDLSIK